MDIAEIERLLAELEKFKVDYALVGGFALNLYGLVRATEDVDLFVLTTGENVDRLKSALKAVFDDPSIDEILAEDLAGQYSTIRYVPPAGTLVIDLIGHIGEMFEYSDLEIEERTVRGIKVRIVTPKTLFEMKRGTLRPKDRADAEALRRRFKLEGD